MYFLKCKRGEAPCKRKNWWSVVRQAHHPERSRRTVSSLARQTSLKKSNPSRTCNILGEKNDVK